MATMIEINKHLKEIIEQAKAGNQLAKDILTFGNMYNRCPESGSRGLLDAAFDEWKKNN